MKNSKKISNFQKNSSKFFNFQKKIRNFNYFFHAILHTAILVCLVET